MVGGDNFQEVDGDDASLGAGRYGVYDVSEFIFRWGRGGFLGVCRRGEGVFGGGACRQGGGMLFVWSS